MGIQADMTLKKFLFRYFRSTYKATSPLAGDLDTRELAFQAINPVIGDTEVQGMSQSIKVRRRQKARFMGLIYPSPSQHTHHPYTHTTTTTSVVFWNLRCGRS